MDLRKLLERNHYTEATVKYYELEWIKTNRYLSLQHGTDKFTMEYGLKYLENQYGIITALRGISTLDMWHDQIHYKKHNH